MKKILSLCFGLVALAAVPVMAQEPAAAGPTGKIHGHVVNPTGAPQTSGNVSAVPPGQPNEKGTVFQVSSNGEYSGDLKPGTYMLVFRQPDTPQDKQVDHIDKVQIVAGQTTEQDIDMSRDEYIKGLPADQQKQLEEIRKKNSEAMKSNQVIKQLNTDLKTVVQDIHDASISKEPDVKTAKYTEAEQIMTKDTQMKPDASLLWAQLGQAELGLKKYDEAISAFKKALDLESTSKKPMLDVQGSAQSGLGEAYARTGKVPEATEAFDAATKVNPPQAAFFLTNEAKIFYQVAQTGGDAKVIEAQVASADKALATNPDPTNPNTALLYYLKGQGLISEPGAVQEDPKTHKLTAPPGSLEAFQKYLDIAPTGQFANDVKGILAGFNQAADTSYKAKKK